MIEREFRDAKGRLWYGCGWTDAVREDRPLCPGLRDGRWSGRALRAKAWLSPTGRVWVLDCADPELAAQIRRSVERRAPQWRSEWVDRGWRSRHGREGDCKDGS